MKGLKFYYKSTQKQQNKMSTRWNAQYEVLMVDLIKSGILLKATFATIKIGQMSQLSLWAVFDISVF